MKTALTLALIAALATSTVAPAVFAAPSHPTATLAPATGRFPLIRATVRFRFTAPQAGYRPGGRKSDFAASSSASLRALIRNFDAVYNTHRGPRERCLAQKPSWRYHEEFVGWWRQQFEGGVLSTNHGNPFPSSLHTDTPRASDWLSLARYRYCMLRQ